MNHESLEALVLNWEDLTDEEWSAVEKHVDTCGACRELLVRVMRAAALVSSLGELPLRDDHELYRLEGELARAERASLRVLKARLEAEHGVGRIR